MNDRSRHLNPKRHRQLDLFIADAWSADPRDDMASMEHPIFALKAGDTRPVHYEHNGVQVTVIPSGKGRATIFDKDIWIYCISRLIAALNEGKPIAKTVRFTAYDFFVNTNRRTDGDSYRRFELALARLRGTTIKTNLETNDRRETRIFGLIESARVIERANGKAVAVEVTLPDWLMRIVEERHVLKINPDYFRLRKPLDRRIYELARKHCGRQGKWTVSLQKLHKKSGSTASLRKFRAAIKSLAESDELPDYRLRLDERDTVHVYARTGKGARAFIDEVLGKSRKRR